MLANFLCENKNFCFGFLNIDLFIFIVSVCFLKYISMVNLTSGFAHLMMLTNNIYYHTIQALH